MSKYNRNIQKMEEWISDWCLFAEEAMGVILDDEQKEVLRSVQHNKMTSVASGAARGKDFIASVAALCFLYLVPQIKGGKPESCKVILSGPTERQIRNIMMPEVANIYHKLRLNGIHPFNARLTAFDIRTDYEDYFLTGFKADEHSHESWSGFHAVNTMFVVTEASAIGENIFSAIESNLQGNSRLLIVFNHNTLTGYASESQRSDRFNAFRLDSLNAPNVKQQKKIIPGQVDYEWVRDKVLNWCEQIRVSEFDETQGDFWFEINGVLRSYRPDDLFRVKVRGMAPKADSDVLIPIDWIEAANRRWQQWHDEQKETNEPLLLGVDVAGMGRDSSCFAYRYGDYVKRFELFQGTGHASHMQVAGNVKTVLAENRRQVWDEYGYRQRTLEASAFIDTIGEGAGVYSRLKEQNVPNVYSCKFSEAAEINDYSKKLLTDKNNIYEFLNMRAYLYWCIRDWLNPAFKSNAMLPKDNELLEELSSTKWEFLSNGKIKIEPKEEIKKRIKRSPDKADALANTFYPVVKRRRQQNVAGFFR